ncbi:TCR/Tet family MFS transporter [Deinococcus peraridilitoris]|uniref:Arabinose efflux permease family protein n=1 Tax=Deinococcus peraridilitoris (strain DSM 19664 / LMG 22246 / CIP 109416 / KR-200) TaxID=937777 RepID=L0A3F6_DEIPD|nr:tetracycline resistance MFS efflux pump [Deinococcus peraridilitoris]AFZ67702.1 arabinose efflux permease family protein [Deinococcus peraridilitoris DSM 19664]
MNLRKPAALVFVLATLLIDVMGIGLIIPVLPSLVKQLAGGEAAGAQMLGILTAVYAAMQFLFAPLLGALSDRFGRRPVLLLSIFGLGLDYLLLYFAPTLAWLFVGRVLAGITGASMAVVNAYVADVTPPEQRAKSYGLLGAMFGLGFIIGPVVGGFLGNIDLRLPFAAAAGLALVNALYGLFVLPESLRPEHRNARIGVRNLSPLVSLAALTRYPLVRNLGGSFILFGLANQVIFNTWVLFTEGVLKWSPAQNGAALALVGVLAIVVQAGLVGFAIKTFGERSTILGGLMVGVVQFGLLGLARTDLMFYIAIIIGSLSGVAGPAMQALISRNVTEREQGTVQGAITSLNSVVGIVGPLLATWVFAYYNGGGAGVRVPGAAFYLGGVCFLLGTLLTAIVLPREPRKTATLPGEPLPGEP